MTRGISMANDSTPKPTEPTPDKESTIELFEGLGWGSPLRVVLVDDPSDPSRQQIVFSVNRMEARGVIQKLHKGFRRNL
jgi:hypothetical protein